MTVKYIGLKYCESQVVGGKGKVKEIMLLLDDEIVGQYDAKTFHRWLSEKVREIGEWMETGSVKSWYPSPLKADEDKLRYVG